LFKVGYSGSPYGSALKMIDENGGIFYFFDAQKNIFSSYDTSSNFCVNTNCCLLDSIYSTPEEHNTLQLLKGNYDGEIDRWMLYYYLCHGSRKSLLSDVDVDATNVAIALMLENTTNFNLFLSWFESVDID
jgi:hypothetical protein